MWLFVMNIQWKNLTKYRKLFHLLGNTKHVHSTMLASSEKTEVLDINCQICGY